MKKLELESRVTNFIQQHKLIPPNETLVVGVSGGADSVCLFRLLARWQDELDIKLQVAHLNHQLRGAESEADAKYVADLAKQLNVPITISRQDVAAYRSKRNCSVEEAARELRYDFLARVADDIGAKRVAIGHTRDDQVETILMHILRGTGTSGLRGLEPCSFLPFCHSEPKAKNLVVIRPLLDITRQETLNYCQEHHLEPRIDSSNLSLSFFRNRCRLELLPLLKKYNPSIDKALLRLAELARDDNSFIEQQALQSWSGVAREEDGAIYLDKRKICLLPLALQRQLIRIAVDKVLGDTRDIEASHIEAIRSLLNKPVGKRISLPHSLACWGEYDEVVMTRGFPLSSLCPFPPLPGEFSLNIPGKTVLPGWRAIATIIPVIASRDSERNEACSPFVIASRSCEPKAWSEAKQSYERFIAQFDLHQAGTELFVRQRQAGDRFQPLGMDMPKKLQHFMVDAKIPLSWRENIPLVCSPKQIIWVVGWRIDDRVKVTEATKEILRLEFRKAS